MWLLEGRFGEDTRVEQSKLLKSGQSYVVGRKIPADIVVDSKFVSRTSCHITVGNLTPEQILNHIDARPTVTIRFEPNKSRKAFTILTPDPSNGENVKETNVAALQEAALHSGDSFALTTTLSFKLVWRPFSICFAGKVKESFIRPHRESAENLGIHFSPAKAKWEPGYTHLCVSQMRPTESVLGALVEAKPIITPAFVEEIVRRGNLKRHDPDSLETHFLQLDPRNYFPEIDPNEFNNLPELEDRMQPQEIRSTMFSGTSCVFFVLPEDEGEFTIYRNILTLAGARVFSHNPQTENLKTRADFTHLLMPYKDNALSYWRNSPSIGKAQAPDDGLLVICNSVHDDTQWKRECTVACVNLRISVPPGFHSITGAIFTTDLRKHLNIYPSISAVEQMEEQAMPPREADPDVTTTSNYVMDPSPAGKQANHSLEHEKGTKPKQDRNNNQSASLAGSTKRIDSPPRPQPMETVTAQAQSELQNQQNKEQPEAEPTRRRPLQRRTKITNIFDQLLGSVAGEVTDLASEPLPSNDNPVVEKQHSREITPETNQHTSSIAETPSIRRATSRLTRRTAADGTRSRRSDIFDDLLRSRPETSAAGQSDRPNGSESVGLQSQPYMSKSRKYRMELDEEDRIQSQLQVQETFAEAQKLSGPQSLDNSMQEDNSSTAIQFSRETSLNDGRKLPSKLGAVAEDQVMLPNPEGNVTAIDSHPSRKRKTDSQDVEMEDGHRDADGIRKRQRSQQVPEQPNRARASSSHTDLASSAAIVKGSSGPANHGLSKGSKPDTEPEFLQALSTQKSRGKKMDEFDAEFNRLQIVKPNKGSKVQTKDVDQNVDEDFEAFKKLAEEELRINVRGNFIQVDFVPLIYKKPTTSQQQPCDSMSDVPNFKKFRSKGQKAANAFPAVTQGRTRTVLHLPEANDYGIGEAYWQNERSDRGPLDSGRFPMDIQKASNDSLSLQEPAPTATRRRTANINLVLSDDSEPENYPRNRRKVSSSSVTKARRNVNTESDDQDQDLPPNMGGGPIRANLDLTGLDSEDEDLSRILNDKPVSSTVVRGRRQQQSAQSPNTVRGSTRNSTAEESSQRSMRGTKRSAASAAGSDEERGRASSSTKSRATKRGKQTVAVYEDDASGGLATDTLIRDCDGGDDGNDGNFGGFTKSTAARSRRLANGTSTPGLGSTQTAVRRSTRSRI